MGFARVAHAGATARVAEGLLRAGWPGTRVLKSSAAAGLAWWAGTHLGGDPAPMFAVFGALNGMQPTVAASVRRTGGTVLGIVLGSALAGVSEAVVDAPRSVMVALLVALGLLITLRLHAYALLGTEVAVTGLLVFALSQGNVLWALGRLGETALGGGIAVLVNALVLPPDYRQDARRATQQLARELALHLRTAVTDTLRPPSRDEARAHLLAARAATRVAEELVVQTARAREALRFSPLLRYSPVRRASPAELERYASGVEGLALGLTHARTASRAAWHASRRPARRQHPGGDWEGLLADVESAVARFERYVLDGSNATFDAADVAVRFALRKHAEVVSANRLGAAAWDMDQAAVLAETEHILDDLHRALRGA
jgi:hypothetical protein